MMKLFISYAKEDKSTVNQIVKACELSRIEVFLDEKDLPWGQSLSESIGRGIQQSTHLLVVLSQHSLTSQWVAYEVGRATERGMTILPYLSSPSIEPPGFLQHLFQIGSIEELQKHFEIFSLSVQGVDVGKRLARLPAAIQGLQASDLAKQALGRCANLILNEYEHHLDELEMGRVDVQGRDIDRVFALFVDAVRRGFKALSLNDLEYWATTESEGYLALNQQLLDKQYGVERIFVLHRDRPLTSAHRVALCRQIRMGIVVRIAFRDSCRTIADDDLDFGLFDTFAVSFFRHSYGRVHRLTTAAHQVSQYQAIYNRVLAVCEKVPVDGRERTVFESCDELSRWINIHGPAEPKVRVAGGGAGA